MTMVKVKLKEFEDIVSISTPIPFRKQEENLIINEFVLELKDSKYKTGLFFCDLYQFCVKEIEVVDKRDYEFEKDYCFYHNDYKYRISDWMLQNERN